MPGLEVDPSEVQTIEVDPSQLDAVQPSATQQIGTSLQNTAKGLFETLHGIVDRKAALKMGMDAADAQFEQWDKAKEHYKNKDYVGAVTGALGAFVPLVGPLINKTADKLATPGQRVEGATDIATQILIGTLASKIPGMTEAEGATKLGPTAQARAVVSDILSHPKVAEALKNAATEAVNEVPGVKTMKRVGKVAQVVHEVGSDVLDQHAARKAAAMAPVEVPAPAEPPPTWEQWSKVENPQAPPLSPETQGAQVPVRAPIEVAPAEVTPVPEAPAAAQSIAAAPIAQVADTAGSSQNVPGSPEVSQTFQTSPAATAPQVLPEIPRTPVKGSSNVESIGYHPDTQRMHVEYKNGTVYEYTGVTPEEYQHTIDAESTGSHLAREIKPSRPTAREAAKAKTAETPKAPEPDLQQQLEDSIKAAQAKKPTLVKKSSAKKLGDQLLGR